MLKISRNAFLRCVIIAFAILLLIAIQPARIAYHRSRMEQYAKALASPSTVDPDRWWAKYDYFNWCSKLLEERHRYHREHLVRLGGLKLVQYEFQHIRTKSAEHRNLWITQIRGGKCPSYDRAAGIERPVCEGDGVAAKLSVWCSADQVVGWQEYVRTLDVPDYRSRFMPQEGPRRGLK